MKIIKFLLLLLVLLILAVVFTPLDWYYSAIEKQIKPAKLEQISGSAIKGSAQKLSYFGMDLGQASWLAYPSSYNEMSVDFTLNNDQYHLQGRYRKSLKFDKIQNLRGRFNWSMLEQYLNFKFGKIAGSIDFDFSEIAFANNTPERIVGQAITQNLKLIEPMKKDLGTINVKFSSQSAGVIVGLINSNSNVINVSGAIYIHKTHRWESKITLLPMPGEYEIEYALQNIGDKRPGGGRSLNMSGYY